MYEVMGGNACTSRVLGLVAQTRSHSLRSPRPVVKPDGQNLVISKWLLPELSFSDRWSSGKKSGNEIGHESLAHRAYD